MSCQEETAMTGYSGNSNNNPEGPSSRKKRENRHKKSLKTFTEEIEIGGLSKTLQTGTPTWRKVAWLAVVLFGVAFCFYQISTQVIAYFAWPVSIHINVSSVNEMTFPTVTICNQNYLRRGSVGPVGREEENDPNFWKKVKDRQPGRQASWEQFYAFHAHQKKDTILKCTWEEEPCTLENFTTVYTDKGVCYQFNSDGKLKVRHKSAAYGLQLTLQAQLDQYLNTSHANELGFKLSVHVPYTPLTVGNEGTLVNVGGLTEIKIKAEKILSLPEPWESCGSVSLDGFKYYSRSACQVECLTDYVIDHVGCRHLYMKHHLSDVCDPATLNNQLKRSVHNYIRNPPPCRHPLCPTPCAEMFYETDTTFAKFSRYYIDKLVQKYGRTEDYWRENAVDIAVYVPFMTETVITHQVAMTAMSLLCDIGGAFGLILGASVVSVLEMFDFAIMHTCYRK